MDNRQKHVRRRAEIQNRSEYSHHVEEAKGDPQTAVEANSGLKSA